MRIPEEKKWRILAAALAVLLAGIIWFPEDDAVSVAALEVPEKGQKDGTWEKEKEKEGSWKILGTESAFEGKKLKNPFTLLHEERGNVVQAGGDAQKADPTERSVPAVAEIPVYAEKGSERGKTSSEWILKGILSGEKGRIAIVSNGEETRDVAVGERFGNRVVTAIEEGSLRFLGEDGEGQLQMPGF